MPTLRPSGCSTHGRFPVTYPDLALSSVACAAKPRDLLSGDNVISRDALVTSDCRTSSLSIYECNNTCVRARKTQLEIIALP